jgi:hypothetical protein
MNIITYVELLVKKGRDARMVKVRCGQAKGSIYPARVDKLMLKKGFVRRTYKGLTLDERAQRIQQAMNSTAWKRKPNKHTGPNTFTKKYKAAKRQLITARNWVDGINAKGYWPGVKVVMRKEDWKYKVRTISNG